MKSTDNKTLSLEVRKAEARTLALNIARFLKAQSKTTWWLSHRVSVLSRVATHPTICVWLCGKNAQTHRIPATAIPVIAKALKCSVGDLFQEAKWVRCECCEVGYWCQLHEMHARDCSCDTSTLDLIERRHADGR